MDNMDKNKKLNRRTTFTFHMSSLILFTRHVKPKLRSYARKNYVKMGIHHFIYTLKAS